MGELPRVLLSAALLALAFPPLSLPLLGFVALLPMLLPHPARPRAWFLLGALIFALHTHWVLFLEVPPTTRLFLNLGFVLMVLYLAAYYGLFGLLRNRLRGGAWVGPSLWVLLEWVRAQGALGFPWIPLWLTHLQDPLFRQGAYLVGPYGLSWATFFLTEGIAEASRKRRVRPLLAPLLLTLALYGFGAFRLLKGSLEEGHPLRIAILQPNVLQELVTGQERGSLLEAYLRLLPQVPEGTELVILPESALPGFFTGKHSKEILDSLRTHFRSPILLAGADYTYGNGVYRYHNTAFLLDASGRLLGRYRKVQLVPFGEWIPYEDRLPILERVELGQGDYRPGKAVHPLHLPSGEGVGVLICYESIFPRLARAQVRHGAAFLANLTSDGWFGRSIGPLDHYRHGIFRAVETDRYLVRAARTGISAIVDPLGREKGHLGLFRPGVLTGEIRLRKGESPYTRTGDWIVALSGLLILAALRGRRSAPGGSAAPEPPPSSEESPAQGPR